MPSQVYFRLSRRIGESSNLRKLERKLVCGANQTVGSRGSINIFTEKVETQAFVSYAGLLPGVRQFVNGDSDSSMSDSEQSQVIQHWLDRLKAGDPAARDALIEHSCERLRAITRKQLRSFPGVHRWEETSDVLLQQAAMRLHRALLEVQPENVRAFMGFAATQVRRELLDLVRHYYGPQGMGAKHARPTSALPIDLTILRDTRRRTIRLVPRQSSDGRSSMPGSISFHPKNARSFSCSITKACSKKRSLRSSEYP